MSFLKETIIRDASHHREPKYDCCELDAGLARLVKGTGFRRLESATGRWEELSHNPRPFNLLWPFHYYCACLPYFIPSYHRQFPATLVPSSFYITRGTFRLSYSFITSTWILIGTDFQ
jgi:hypothetical protein